MKKLLLATILISGFAFSQEFVLTPENFKNKSDQTKDYVVIEAEGQTQKQLFDKTKMFIHSNYKNLKGDGYNEVEFSQIKLRARSNMDTGKKVLGYKVDMPFTNTYEIGFKDGKIMVKPYFEYIEKQDKYDSKIYLTGGSGVLGKSIFNKNGEIWMQGMYDGVLSQTNDFVNGLKAAINKADSEW